MKLTQTHHLLKSNTCAQALHGGVIYIHYSEYCTKIGVPDVCIGTRFCLNKVEGVFLVTLCPF